MRGKHGFQVVQAQVIGFLRCLTKRQTRPSGNQTVIDGKSSQGIRGDGADHQAENRKYQDTFEENIAKKREFHARNYKRCTLFPIKWFFGHQGGK